MPKDSIRRIKGYIEQGYTRAVILDLSKYFETLNHTILLNLLRKQMTETKEDSLQSGNLSPLLANCMQRYREKGHRVTCSR